MGTKIIVKMKENKKKKSFGIELKKFWRIIIYLTQWMPYGWNPSEMTKKFWLTEDMQ